MCRRPPRTPVGRAGLRWAPTAGTGLPAHDVSGEGLTGEIVAVRTVGVEHDTVLVFLSSGCSGCTTFWEQLADRGGVAAVGRCRVLVVTKSPQDESVGLLRELCPRGVDLVMSSQAWDDYAVPGSPYVIVVDGRSGRVKGEGSGTSLTQVSGLMQQAYGDGASAPAGGRQTARRTPSGRSTSTGPCWRPGIGPGHPSLYTDGASRTRGGAAEPPTPRPDRGPPRLPQS